MKQCLIIGRPNVGKTLFAIRFAEHLGLAAARISFAKAGGKRWEEEYSLGGAVSGLTSSTPHHTRQLQSFTLRLPAGKGSKQFELIDSSGLVDGIHPDQALRLSMAQTLAAVQTAKVILHMMDAAAIGTAPESNRHRGGNEAATRTLSPPLDPSVNNPIGEVDLEIAHYGIPQGGYLLLANKMDLPGAPEGLARLRRQFSGCPIAPVSALNRQGFDEVKAFVRRRL